MEDTISKSDEDEKITDDLNEHFSTDNNAQEQIEQYLNEHANVTAMHFNQLFDGEQDSIQNVQNEQSNENTISFESFSDDEFKLFNMKKLEEFWVGGSDKGIKELEYLNNKESIKKIVLKQNIFKDNEKLAELIINFQNLKL